MTRSHHDGCGGSCFICSRPDAAARRMARAPQLADQLTRDEALDLETDVCDQCEGCDYCDPSHANYVAYVLQRHGPAVDDLIAAEEQWSAFRRVQDFRMLLAEVTVLFVDDASFAPG